MKIIGVPVHQPNITRNLLSLIKSSLLTHCSDGAHTTEKAQNILTNKERVVEFGGRVEFR